MSTELLSIIIILFAVTGVFIFIYLKRGSKDHANISAARQIERELVPAINHHSEIGCDLAVFDENGLKIIESREIHQIPARAHSVESSNSAINRVRHLASDLFKGAESIPNKTVEVIFKQDIQKGLSEGTYTLMRTKSGEVLTDAVDSSGAIVGKGRLIQGGKARQLAGGAFQLVSIAVAQSHLADIEQSLSIIKDSISEVIERQENEDKARITGAFDYLREIAIHMKELRCPDELSQQKKNVIEGIIKDSYTWRNKLEEDISSLINQIADLKDLDSFGTGSTYERLKELTGKIDPLLKRRELLLHLASATNFVTAYLDPAQSEFSKINPDNENWADLIGKFNTAVMDRESTLMSKSFWNSSETLQLRKDKIKSLSSDYRRMAIDQQNHYVSLHGALEKSIKSLMDTDGNVHVAISFDERGDVKGAAIL